MVDNRGQAISIEALFASFILIIGVTLAFQVTVINPDTLGADTDQFNESNQISKSKSLLEASSDTGDLKSTLLYWNETSAEFYNTDSQPYYTTKQPTTELGDYITDAYSGDETVNIEIKYWADTDGDGTLETETQWLVRQGSPDDSAVSVQYTTTLYDNDVLRNSDETKSSTELGSASSFYAPDAYSSNIYNVVTVKVVIWE